MKTRNLTHKDLAQVKALDGISGWDYAQFLQEEDAVDEKSFGIFDNDVLVGYCLIGDANDVGPEIYEDEDYSPCESRLLDEVFIHPDHRRRGVGTEMITEALSISISIHENVYCIMSSLELINFYGQFGFEKIGGLSLKRT